MCTTFAWRPLRPAVPTFAIGDYRSLTQAAMAIRYVTGHESYARGWATAGEKIAPFIAQWFGPRKQPVQIVELPDKDMAPFEAGSVLFTPLVSGQENDVQVVLAHQFAHASFQSPRLWIEEGLAHFAQALEREQQEGRAAALAYMDERLPPLQEAEKEFLAAASGKVVDPPPQGQSLIESSDGVFFRTKAMFVWWMLRDMVGDEALERAIRAYRPEQDKDASYLQRLLAAQFHRDLEWFFDDWVYRDRGLPEFHITEVYPRKLIPEDWSVTVAVENTGSAGAEVPIAVRAAQGEERKRLEVRAHEKASVRIPIPVLPKQAVVNDGSVPAFEMDNNSAEISTPEVSQ
jgi:aminopeptidase N